MAQSAIAKAKGQMIAPLKAKTERAPRLQDALSNLLLQIACTLLKHLLKRPEIY